MVMAIRISLLPILLLLFFLLSVTVRAEPYDSRQPREFTFLKIHGKSKQEAERARGCTYTVKIETSCSSPRYTSDSISLAFGDRYGNEVYAPRLDDPSTGTFESCSTDTFKMQGPCGYGVCYLYLRRYGYDGWTPDWVKIYEPNYSRATTFYYGTPLPNGVWYGFNQCNSAGTGLAAH